MLTLEDLRLRGRAAEAAAEVQAACPWVIFTSGSRTVVAQAAAMAANIVASGRRRWIAQTYRATPLVARLQRAVDGVALLRRPDLERAILAELCAELRAHGALKNLASLSRHLTGEAFDVQPEVGARGEELARAIMATRPAKFLTQEGGLTRWHAQY